MVLPKPADNANPGDAGHATDHNLIRDALVALDSGFIEYANIQAGTNVTLTGTGKDRIINSSDSTKLVAGNIQGGTGINVANPSGNTVVITATGGGGGSTIANRDEIAVTFSGTLNSGQKSQTIQVMKPFKLLSVRLSALTPPVNSAGGLNRIAVDIVKTGTVANTSIFPSGVYPKLSPGSNWEGMAVQNETFSAGDLFYLEIKDTGSSVPGADLAVSLEIEYVENITTFETFANKGEGTTAQAVTNANSGPLDTNWTTVSNGGTSTTAYEAAATSSAPNQFTRVIKFSNDTNANNFLKYEFPADVKELYVRFYCRLPNLNPSGGTNLSTLMRVYAADGTTALTRLQMNNSATPTGDLVLVNAVSNATLGTTVGAGVTANSWFRVELRMIAGPTNFFKLDLFTTPNGNSPVETISGSPTATNWTGFGAVEFGKVTGVVATPPSVYHMAGFHASSVGWGGVVV